MLRDSGIPVLGGLENMAVLDCPHCREPMRLFPETPADRSIWADSVTKPASIPFDSTVVTRAEAGLRLLQAEDQDPHSKVFRWLAASVAEAYPEE